MACLAAGRRGRDARRVDGNPHYPSYDPTNQEVRNEDRRYRRHRLDRLQDRRHSDVALAAPRNGIVEIAGPEQAPFNEIVARYLKAVGDPREVVSDPEARYFGGRVEERSLVRLGEARLGRIGFDEWLRRSRARA